jgi:hypothetical protein
MYEEMAIEDGGVAAEIATALMVIAVPSPATAIGLEYCVELVVGVLPSKV